MKKEKIAISIDNSLLEIVDSHINNTTVRSRSQAIELLIQQALKQRPINVAVMLIHEKSQKHLFESFEGFTLIQHHLNFLIRNNVKKLYLVTKETDDIKNLIKQSPKQIDIKLVNEEKALGTASALSLIKDNLKTDFILMNGDTFNDFDLKNMIKFHQNENKIATMGLLSSSTPQKRGSVLLDGNLVIDFKEKQQTKSNVVNAGIYILNARIFDLFNNSKSLEKDIFPILAKQKQLQGFFTFGKFIHMPEKLQYS